MINTHFCLHNLPKKAALLGMFSLGSACLTASDVLISDIQGAQHISPLDGETVRTTGVVTAVDFLGFYLQDPVGDGDPDTSEGIFVFTGRGPGVQIGDDITIEAQVSEFIPGGAATGNLSTTQLSGAAITINSSGNPLPEPVILGRGGRTPPNTTVISSSETDPAINLQNAIDAASTPFNPEIDGIDFYESLEGMRVKVGKPVAVSPTRTFSRFSSEMVVLADRGRDVAPRNARTRRGGISLQAHPDNLGDQNPERIQLQFDSDILPMPVPAIRVGDRLSDVIGVVGYSFGNFEVNASEPFEVSTNQSLRQERSHLKPRPWNITLASYNVLNLSADASDDNQRTAIAAQIVNQLRAPDVIALQEIQDNSGQTDDGTTDASQTLQALVDAIVAAGGPEYAFFDVAPPNNAWGGVPGGNIRNAYLYKPQRVSVTSFVSLQAAELAAAGADPDAFAGTRAPLAATFADRWGREFTVVNNHMTSRFGSTPIFGAIQPFVQAGETAREAQAGALNNYVDHLLSDNPRAAIVVLGDLNTFEFSNDIANILRGENKVLHNLIDTLHDDNVYTFNFEGNSQVLDHILVSPVLKRRAKLDIVHVNVDFPRIDDTVASDHEPLVVALRLPWLR